MQKVVGSSPISRFDRKPRKSGVFCWEKLRAQIRGHQIWASNDRHDVESGGRHLKAFREAKASLPPCRPTAVQGSRPSTAVAGAHWADAALPGSPVQPDAPARPYLRQHAAPVLGLPEPAHRQCRSEPLAPIDRPIPEPDSRRRHPLVKQRTYTSPYLVVCQSGRVDPNDRMNCRSSGSAAGTSLSIIAQQSLATSQGPHSLRSPACHAASLRPTATLR